MKTFKLTIATPEGNLFKGEVIKLSLRGIGGELAVMAGHIPFITAVKPCDYRIEFAGGEEKTGRMDGGLLSVSSEEVTLLSGRIEM